MDWKVIDLTEMDEVIDLLDVSFAVSRDVIKRDLAETLSNPRENGKIHRLRLDGKLIATATYGSIFDGESWNGESYIRYLAVHPDHRRKGYATRIIQKIMDDTQAVGSPSIYVSVLQSDSISADIWKRLGFELYDTSAGEEDPDKYDVHDYYAYHFGDK